MLYGIRVQSVFAPSPDSQLQELPPLIFRIGRQHLDEVLHRSAVKIIPVIGLDGVLEC